MTTNGNSSVEHEPSALGRVALRRGSQNLYDLLASCRDALLFIDEKSRITLLNPAAEQMFRYSLAEVFGHRIEILMPDPYASRHADYVDHYERGGEPQAIGKIRQVRGRRSNGEVFPCELSVTALGSHPEGRYAAFIRDVSDREQLHAELVDKERLASLGMGASVLAHEIANPLNNMLLQAQLLERRLPADGDARLLEGIRAITGEVRRLESLLTDFRRRSRRTDAPHERVDLARLSDEVLRLHAPPRDELRLETQFDPELPSVAGYSDKLKQLLVNLIKNAVEAMSGQGTLRVAARRSGLRVELSVQDTGPGLDEEADVFQPFFTTKRSGTGLGLSVAREIAISHGGAIRHERPADGGTRFVVTLPAGELPA